ncbi:hypothetical protein [Methanosphaera cuniculi]|uniref:Uncharacterized protein n=1 Tax=Methanosphaera cuniculi TaxID=1077256 RepID=A0A2A2HB94_9EURY|nr:hypothetical protein [Methanosphaera cuniculi]PAV06513.1 hypothetical protein ASJ82_04655 [Methanosphaera cuniculi]PWL09007.1 hypothetical protein MSCUN_00680 [Methanosphaera cuniculi]
MKITKYNCFLLIIMIIIILSSITVISANDTNSTRNLNYNISSNDSYMMENNTSINFKQKIDNNIIKENTNNNL